MHIRKQTTIQYNTNGEQITIELSLTQNNVDITTSIHHTTNNIYQMLKAILTGYQNYIDFTEVTEINQQSRIIPL